MYKKYKIIIDNIKLVWCVLIVTKVLLMSVNENPATSVTNFKTIFKRSNIIKRLKFCLYTIVSIQSGVHWIEQIIATLGSDIFSVAYVCYCLKGFSDQSF